MTKPKPKREGRVWKAWGCFTEYWSLIGAFRLKDEADHAGRHTRDIFAYMVRPVTIVLTPEPAPPAAGRRKR